MRLYRNRYRVESPRLLARDYAASGWYFVTFGTNDRSHHFEEVRAGGMLLTTARRAAHRCLAALPDHVGRVVRVRRHAEPRALPDRPSVETGAVVRTIHARIGSAFADRPECRAVIHIPGRGIVADHRAIVQVGRDARNPTGRRSGFRLADAVSRTHRPRPSRVPGHPAVHRTAPGAVARRSVLPRFLNANAS